MNDPELEARLRAELTAYAETINPNPRGLEIIRARIARRRRCPVWQLIRRMTR
jgi:hypothetical protein